MEARVERLTGRILGVVAACTVCTAAARGEPVPSTSDALPGILSFGNGFRECVALKHGK